MRKNKTDKIDSEAVARYLIISNNNAINMEYPDLKEDVNIYFRLTRKLTGGKKQIIRNLGLLYLGMTSLVNINAKYFVNGNLIYPLHQYNRKWDWSGKI